MPRAQTADKPRKHKNSFRQKKSGRNFCLLRQLHLQSAVTYACVSSLDCKFASLPCKVFQSLAKRRLCQRFEPAAFAAGSSSDYRLFSMAATARSSRASRYAAASSFVPDRRR